MPSGPPLVRPPARGDRPLVTLMSSNGAGLGHLTRLLAYGRHLPVDLDVHVLSMSQGVSIVAELGHDFEYLPSRGGSGLSAPAWRPLFLERLVDYLRRRRPAVVVFDGTHPYAGIDVARELVPETRWVWSRRGMWKPGRNADQLAKGAWFDLVLEPGDLAAEQDQGATRGSGALVVPPVTLVDRDDVESRAQARSSLGLPPEGRLALVSLGAGNLNDTSGDLGRVAEVLRGTGIGMVVTSSAIAERSTELSGVSFVRHFPLPRKFAAFDIAVSAAGYNSFHESLRLGLPTYFVPNLETSLDDQAGRARAARDRGWALAGHPASSETLDRDLARLLDEGSALADRALEADPGNGASAAASHIARLALEAA